MDKATFDLVKDLQQIRIDIQNKQRRLEDSITASLRCVDELTHRLPDSFDLTTAVALCKAGYFVKHLNFSSKESLHYYNGTMYYEDGTAVNLMELVDDNLGDHWSVKKNPLELDLIKLKELHEKSDGIMLDGGSYEECFK